MADLELRLHDSLRAKQGLDPLADPSARSQFRAMCYRQISARLGHAVAKASVMRLLGIPRLPVPASVPRALLTRNCPYTSSIFSSVSLSSPFALPASLPLSVLDALSHSFP